MSADEARHLVVRQCARTNAVARVVTEYLYRSAVRRVRRYVEDAGGTWAGLLADSARAKVRSVLKDEDESRAVIHYHSVVAAGRWADYGPADDELRHAVRRVRCALGTLLPNHAACLSLDLLLSLAGVHPGSLTPEQAERIRASLGRG
jgi:hypothetical protein